jgi:hypothetical protein
VAQGRVTSPTEPTMDQATGVTGLSPDYGTCFASENLCQISDPSY